GTAAHLVGWLRAAVGRVAHASPVEPTAVLLTAPSASAEEDAELFRVAHLVHRYGGPRWIEVAFVGGEPDIEEGVARCRLLGARRVTVVPASFARPALPEGVTWAGPLLTPAVMRELVGRRTGTARERWERHGDDGLAAVSHGHHHHHDH
ncbi:sirohydrochlorin chelatase, partial [Streptosporangium saharense]|uniref:sirohydrochlorin chelatase n=1 Tax=Streptosporangium saharense TaxID=1706840 RepID=UPI00334DFAFC